MAKSDQGRNSEGAVQRLEKAVGQLEETATGAQKKIEALKAEKKTLEEGISSLRSDYEMLERKINDLADQKQSGNGTGTVDPSVKADLTGQLDRIIGRLETITGA